MSTILPGPMANGHLATLGVMGGGQLGRMFVQAAQSMGYFTAVLDPDPSSPAGLISHFHIQTGYLDEQGLAQLMQRCAAITTEFENVPAPALHTLGAHRPVCPGAHAVAIAQDRRKEKAHFAYCGVACAPYALIETEAELMGVSDHLLPGILKTSRMGYDGKGQIRVADRVELKTAWTELSQVECVLEKMLPLKAEYSVIMARGADGTCVHFPVQKNTHHDGVLAVTEVFEESLSFELAEKAIKATQNIAEQLQYVGVLCVEYFLLNDDTLVVNEMAPRPHNSGHYTLDACDQSQFDLQVRTLTGLPLVEPRQHSPAIMLNLLGDLWFQGDGQTQKSPSWDKVLGLPGVHLHLYGKLQAKRGRKMGHLTITASTVQEVRNKALVVAECLSMRLNEGKP